MNNKIEFKYGKVMRLPGIDTTTLNSRLQAMGLEIRRVSGIISELYAPNYEALGFPRRREKISEGVFTDASEIQAQGTGKKVSADDLDALFADIDELTKDA